MPQLDLLDRIAGTSPLADAYVDALSQLRSVESRLDELADMDDEEERARMQKLVDAVREGGCVLARVCISVFGRP